MTLSGVSALASLAADLKAIRLALPKIVGDHWTKPPAADSIE